MAHHDWIFPVVGGYLGGILTGIYGHVGKYSFDQATKLKELIVEIRRAISDFENHPLLTVSLGPAFTGASVELNPAFSNYASDLKSKLELIPWHWYALIRLLRLVSLPPKKKIYKAAELLPQLAVHEVRGPQLRQEVLSIAKNIIDLLM